MNIFHVPKNPPLRAALAAEGAAEQSEAGVVEPSSSKKTNECRGAKQWEATTNV